ncbi:MAG TPA: undecaprenyl-diphosphate phosphatase [Thermoanaerobaculia bacterium]|nr:undecaprenyl-diphosphate phosphatase [Thermoanaerobaculia bacterium]
MSLLQALILALVQGVTEFLPISSSAHLILLPFFMEWPDQGLVFDVATNTGTLLAVMLYFRHDLGRLATGVLSRRPGVEVEGMAPWRFVLALVLGTIPVAVGGLLFDDWIGTHGRSPTLIAWTSIGFGLLLGAADWLGRRRRGVADLRLVDAVVVGLFQALALVPGTSRSGITMTAALLLGFNRPAAARFSFLLSIPVGILVAGWDVLQVVQGKADVGGILPLVVGLVGAAVSAYLVIGWLIAWLERQTMAIFVVYRVVLGAVILLLVAWQVVG